MAHTTMTSTQQTPLRYARVVCFLNVVLNTFFLGYVNVPFLVPFHHFKNIIIGMFLEWSLNQLRMLCHHSRYEKVGNTLF